jgi:hypothetical protein
MGRLAEARLEMLRRGYARTKISGYDKRMVDGGQAIFEVA